jgi:hypothetical protein
VRPDVTEQIRDYFAYLDEEQVPSRAVGGERDGFRFDPATDVVASPTAVSVSPSRLWWAAAAVVIVIVGFVLVRWLAPLPTADTPVPTTAPMPTTSDVPDPTAEERPTTRGERFVAGDPSPISATLGPISWTRINGPEDTIPFRVVKSEDGGYLGYSLQGRTFVSEDALKWTESTDLPTEPPLSYGSIWTLNHDPYRVEINAGDDSKIVDLAPYSNDRYRAVESETHLLLNPSPDNGVVDLPILVIDSQGNVTDVESPWQGPASIWNLESGGFVAYTTLTPIGVVESPTSPIEVWTSNDGVSWTSEGAIGFDYSDAVRVLITGRSDGRIIADVEFNFLNFYERWETRDGVNWSQSPLNTPVTIHTQEFDYGHVMASIEYPGGFWLSTDNGDTWEHIAGPEDFTTPGNGGAYISAAGEIVYYVRQLDGLGETSIWIGRFTEAG